GWRWRAAASHSGRFAGRGWRNPLAPGGPRAAEVARRKTMADQAWSARSTADANTTGGARVGAHRKANTYRFARHDAIRGTQPGRSAVARIPDRGRAQPAGTTIAFVTERKVAQLPAGLLFWRVETFPS